MTTVRFMVDDWLVDVPAGRIARDGEAAALEPLLMAVLIALCRAPGTVLSAEDLLDACWQGPVSGDNPVHRVIANLRRALGDSTKAPRYIETLRKRGYRLVAPVRVVSSEGERSLGGGWRGKSPFCGLGAFGREHASVFFGRDDAVATLMHQLAVQSERGRPLVMLFGPSGSGKTSLVQAGLVPALLAGPRGPATPGRPRAHAAALLDLGTHEELGLWRALSATMLDWEIGDHPLLGGHSIETLADELRERPASVMRLLQLALDALPAPAAPPLLVLDRFEALLRTASDAQVDRFVAALDTMVRSRALTVLVVCRNDFYAEVARRPALMQGKAHGAHVDLVPPDAQALAQMVRLPAEAAGLRYGKDPSGLRRLDDILCADAAQARDALPLLQYALQSLYLAREPGDELTWEAYEAMGGLEGAIGQRAEATLAALSVRQQDALPRLLPRLVGLTADEAAPAGRWVRSSELEDADERALVQALVEARLLVADRLGGVAGVRVAHEALLRRWPRVTSWIARHRATLALRDELLAWVRRWRDGGRAKSLLLPNGQALWQAADAVANAGFLFDKEQRNYVAASLARQRQQARLRWAGSAAAVLLAVAAGAAAAGYARLASVAASRELQSQHLASFMLGDLADRLRPIGKLDLLASIGEQGLALLGREGSVDESPNDILQRAKALVMIGEVEGSGGRGRVKLALDALGRAERLLPPLESAPGVSREDYYKTLGADAFWQAQIAYDANDFERATALMARYRAACERWRAALPASEQARLELGYAAGSLGSIAMRRGAWAQAARSFDESLALKLDVLRTQGDDAQMAESVATTRTWLGRLAVVQGEPQRALALLDAAYDSRQALSRQHPDERRWLYEVGVLDVHRADALRALRRDAHALEAMREGVALLREAVANDPANQRWLAESLAAESAQLQLRLDVLPPAAQDGHTLLDLRSRLAGHLHTQPRSDFTWRLVDARLAVLEAQLLAGQGQWRRALDATAEAAPRLDALLAELAHDPQAWDLQARRTLIGIRALTALGPPEALHDWCERSVATLRASVDSGQAGLLLETWLRARQCAGAGDPDPASLRRLTAGGYQPAILPTIHG